MKIVLCCYILLGIYKLLRLIQAQYIMKLEGSVDVKSATDCKRILIIVPVYMEQNRVGVFIKNFEKVKYDESKLRVVFCTTEKESGPRDTQTVLENILEDTKLKHNYSIFRYPYKEGNMAHQINYVYQNYKDDSDIVGIYNADSILREDILYQVNYKFEDAEVNYVQQRSTFANYKGNNIFAKGYVFYQSIFDIVKNYAKDSKGKGENVCGRGLFIRKDTIQKEIFPTDFFCEDMALSLIISYRKEKVVGVSCLEENEPPASLKDIVNQQFVWFHTASKVVKMSRYAKKCSDNNINFKTMFKLFRRIIDNFLWMSTSVWLLMLCIYYPWFILAILTYSAAMCFICNKLFYYKRRFYISDVIGFSAYLFILSIGPLKCILINFLNLIGIQVEELKYKTPRKVYEDEEVNNYSR